MRRSELERKAVAKTAKGSIGTAARKGAMAAYARVTCAEDIARMAEEYPGVTNSATMPSASAAEETTEEAD
eukprot:840495-Pleurochrysis_carterae.AAC.1